MTAAGNERSDVATTPRRHWPLAFPTTYLVHIAEEWWGGFLAWSARFLGFQLTPAQYWRLNGIAWVAMLVMSLVATRGPDKRWLVIPLATAVLVNGLAHLVASLVTATYSPGVISGVVLWVPLGAVVLRRMFSQLERRLFWSGVALGFVLHLAVTLSALTSTRC